MFEKIFDRAKGFAVTALFALLFMTVGVASLTVAAAWYLSDFISWPGALAATGGGLLVIALISVWVGTARKKPEPPPQDEIDPVQLAMAVLDMPVEVTKRIIAERPVAAMVAVSGLGLLIARRPQAALKIFDKIVEQFGGKS